MARYSPGEIDLEALLDYKGEIHQYLLSIAAIAPDYAFRARTGQEAPEDRALVDAIMTRILGEFARAWRREDADASEVDRREGRPGGAP